MTRAQLEHLVRAAGAITDASSKLVAGREKDVGFVTAMLAHGLIEPRTLEAHLGLLPEPEQRARAVQIYTVVQSKISGDCR